MYLYFNIVSSSYKTSDGSKYSVQLCLYSSCYRRQMGDFEPGHILNSYWRKWNSEAIKVRVSAIETNVTERYKVGIKRFQDWLREPGSQADFPDIEERCEDLKSSINVNLYRSWKHDKPLWMKALEDVDSDEMGGWKMTDVEHLCE